MLYSGKKGIAGRCIGSWHAHGVGKDEGKNLVLFRPAPRSFRIPKEGEPGVWVPVEGKPITHERGDRASLLSMSCIRALDSLLGAGGLG